MCALVTAVEPTILFTITATEIASGEAGDQDGRIQVVAFADATNRPFHSAELAFYHLAARWLVNKEVVNQLAPVVGESTQALRL